MPIGWKKYYLRYKKYFLSIYSLYQKKPELKSYLELFLSLLAIAFFLIFALKPTLLTITQLLKDIDAKEEIIRKMDTKIQNLEIASELYASEEENITLVNDAVPQDPDPTGFVRQLEGLSRETNVNILGLTVREIVLVGEEPTDQKRADNLAPLPSDSDGLGFSISVSGGYQSLSSFISLLENMRRPVKIDTIGLTAAQTREGQVLVLIVSGRSLYLK
ncbi:hypothetical protein M1545_03735 [Patescibacteria group bacterium]|nr:hypothetical protein [Patescibacteria group bacterium]